MLQYQVDDVMLQCLVNDQYKVDDTIKDIRRNMDLLGR